MDVGFGWWLMYKTTLDHDIVFELFGGWFWMLNDLLVAVTHQHWIIVILITWRELALLWSQEYLIVLLNLVFFVWSCANHENSIFSDTTTWQTTITTICFDTSEKRRVLLYYSTHDNSVQYDGVMKKQCKCHLTPEHSSEKTGKNFFIEFYTISKGWDQYHTLLNTQQ